ncbi:hypothetical protein AEP_03780 [Curvibacter sp. AEP1-3]|uniref:hypothetical protein n=1 Tax=Curvibacter sp. AEP1-3 TaxID=1844971 RepID=UPI000B573C78|nr:hypothetical protein [Curvibacter sp. AEP1-3]ARV20697.1 hypothetical protein AEP_03780 [Curvibacter sp. AEP1-3]
MTRHIRVTRYHAILRVQQHLETKSFPRLQMALLVALTGAGGWLCSALLLHAGMHSMALRYPLAVGAAYGFFMLLLWLWLRIDSRDFFDLPSPNWNGTGSSRHCADAADLAAAPFKSGGGGDYAGGGASAPWDSPALDSPALGSPSLPSTDTPGLFSGLSDAAGSVSDADEIAIPLIAIVMAVGMALASLYVIYIAPVLFSELMFDGVLSYTLYRRLRTSDSPHWVQTAMRHTAVPFAVTALLLALVGLGLGLYAPGAHSLGQALAQHAAH